MRRAGRRKPRRLRKRLAISGGLGLPSLFICAYVQGRRTRTPMRTAPGRVSPRRLYYLESIVNKPLIAAALFACVVATPVAQANGCLKGAAVGGVAGHVAGRHGALGAAAGCAVGHHRAAKKEKAQEGEQAQQTQSEQQSRQERSDQQTMGAKGSRY